MLDYFCSAVIFYLVFLWLVFSFYFQCFFVKLGFRVRFKESFIGFILLEFQFFISSVLYIIYMNSEIMLPGELSIISLLNVFYSFYKPFTRIFSDNNYDKYIGIAEMIFSMLLPIVLFYIGKLLKKDCRKKVRILIFRTFYFIIQQMKYQP